MLELGDLRNLWDLGPHFEGEDNFGFVYSSYSFSAQKRALELSLNNARNG